jgi:aspartate/methionine/tyrosine aminotransferase
LDEVFGEYRLSPASPGSQPEVPAGVPPAGLTFLLNGLSKMAAMPQLKLGWIAIRGDSKLTAAARTRLEFMNDIFLSANTPAQAALPELLAAGAIVRGEILGRIGSNLEFLRSSLDGVNGCSVLPCEGGWNAVVRLPGGLTDEACAEGLLDETGVYCYPGYFFEFEEDDVVIVSLLPPPPDFQEGIRAIAAWIGVNAGQPY